MTPIKAKMLTLVAALLMAVSASGADKWKHDIFVAQDGSGDYATVTEALEGIRAYMDYTVTVHIADGIYKEKIVIPSWLKNVVFEGASAEGTIITNDHHANIDNMGTFRTYTVKVDASEVTFKNLTIENNAPQLGQAVALHTEGDKLHFSNCRFLGNQDTLYTGGRGARLYFEECYIEGTTDFIFGSATALFNRCHIHGKMDSYITAASTAAENPVGYVFYQCKVTAAPDAKALYLGRPWRPNASTFYIECELPSAIHPAGWHNWGKASNEATARYGEYGCTGEGAAQESRVEWRKTLGADEAARLVSPEYLFGRTLSWKPF